MTDQDLEKLGVLLAGHRRKMLRAIAELNKADTTAVPTVMAAPIPAAVVPPPISAPVEATGERRYLTVLFCDLAGSTSISAGLDAEDHDLVGVPLTPPPPL